LPAPLIILVDYIEKTMASTKPFTYSTLDACVDSLAQFFWMVPKVRVVALGGHFATLCQQLDFYKTFFFITNFQKEKVNTSTLLIILIVKSLQIELHKTGSDQNLS
jgi:hypothetical protein